MSESSESTEENDIASEDATTNDEPTTENVEGGNVEAAQAEESLEDKISRLENELKEEKDKSLRSQAEMINFRKRLEKEKGSWNQLAVKDTISSILDPLDNLERTIDASEKGSEDGNQLQTLAEGLKMVMQQFKDAFERKNVICIDPKGEVFNPNEQEAYGQIETDEVEEGHVVNVFRKGYKIGDTLIRTATVQVAKKVSPSEDSGDESDS